MVVNDLDVMSVTLPPHGADTILVVDPDAVLSQPVSTRSFDAVARERAEVIESLGRVQLRQPALRHPGDPPKTGVWGGRGTGPVECQPPERARKCRVPFGLIPVMAATAVMSTARPSHTSQLMRKDRIHVDPRLGTCWNS